MTKKACFWLLMTAAIAGSASEEVLSLDEFFLTDNLVPNPVALGHGGLEVLTLIEHIDVRPLYEKLLALGGEITISAQRVKEDEQIIERYTFDVYRQKGKGDNKLIGQLCVHRYPLQSTAGKTRRPLKLIFSMQSHESA